jgi:coenzyme F420 hydrogenase subunit beta
MSRDAFDRVVGGGYCVGCGACAALPSSGVKMSKNALGMYQATLEKGLAQPSSFESVCPFADGGEDESGIGRRIFDEVGIQPNEAIGRHLSCYAGHVAAEDFRECGSSGGFTSWFLAELLSRGIIDSVLHVSPQDDGSLFRYDRSATRESVRSRAKSRYFPIEMSAVLHEIKERDVRHAVVGLPCFIKAVRRMAAQDPTIADRLTVTVSLVCGHLKSEHFATYLAQRTAAVPRNQIAAIDFRKKMPPNMSADYGVSVLKSDGSTAAARMAHIYGGNWGYGFFRYEACHFCDDVLGETADVSVGDAWLNGYVEDPGGANVVITRRRWIDEIIRAGMRKGALRFDKITAADAARSQAGGLRDRREGLSVRLALKDQQGAWRPRKRVVANLALPRKRREIYDLRWRIARESHTAFAEATAEGDLTVFDRRMLPLTDRYDALHRPSLTRRIIARLRRLAKRIRDLMLRWRKGGDE